MIRPASEADHDATWEILEPIIRVGETYPLPRNIDRAGALAFWFAQGHDVFVADADQIVGTYYLRANQPGAGSHVANCGYATAMSARGRGIGRMMCEHSLDRARALGFRAMQFNFVVSTNEGAVRLWERCGFAVVGRVPGAFDHPVHGYVDALIMVRPL